MKPITTFLLPLAGGLLLLVAPGCGRRAVEDLLDEGAERLRARDCKAAAHAFRQASRRIADSAPLYYNLGVACFGMGDLAGAEQAFTAALDLAPDDAPALEHLAHVHLQRQSWQEARTLFERALARAAPADRPRLLNGLALAERGLGRDDIACLRLLQARRADFRHPPTLYNLGSLYRDKYQLLEEAIDLFELYLRVAPADDPHVDKARDAIRRLKTMVASRVAGDAARVPRRDIAAAARACREAETHLAARQWARAEAAYARALAADPLHYEAAIGLGRARSASGQWREAVKAYQRAAEIAPDKVEPLHMQAREAYLGGDLALAAQLLTTQVIPRWPDYAPAFQLMALVRHGQKLPAEARLYGEHYLELTPGQSPQREAFARWLETLPR